MNPVCKCPDDFKPSYDVYTLAGRLGIPIPFVDELIPEFIYYWKTTNKRRGGWDRTFVNHIKKQWSYKKQQERKTVRTSPGSNKEWITPEKREIATTRPSLKALKRLAAGG